MDLTSNQNFPNASLFASSQARQLLLQARLAEQDNGVDPFDFNNNGLPLSLQNNLFLNNPLEELFFSDNPLQTYLELDLNNPDVIGGIQTPQMNAPNSDFFFEPGFDFPPGGLIAPEDLPFTTPLPVDGLDFNLPGLLPFEPEQNLPFSDPFSNNGFPNAGGFDFPFHPDLALGSPVIEPPLLPLPIDTPILPDPTATAEPPVAAPANTDNQANRLARLFARLENAPPDSQKAQNIQQQIDQFVTENGVDRNLVRLTRMLTRLENAPTESQRAANIQEKLNAFIAENNIDPIQVRLSRQMVRLQKAEPESQRAANIQSRIDTIIAERDTLNATATISNDLPDPTTGNAQARLIQLFNQLANTEPGTTEAEQIQADIAELQAANSVATPSNADAPPITFQNPLIQSWASQLDGLGLETPTAQALLARINNVAQQSGISDSWNAQRLSYNAAIKQLDNTTGSLSVIGEGSNPALSARIEAIKEIRSKYVEEANYLDTLTPLADPSPTFSNPQLNAYAKQLEQFLLPREPEAPESMAAIARFHAMASLTGDPADETKAAMLSQRIQISQFNNARQAIQANLQGLEPGTDSHVALSARVEAIKASITQTVTSYDSLKETLPAEELEPEAPPNLDDLQAIIGENIDSALFQQFL